MACHLIIFNLWFYDGNDLQQVLDKATGKLHCKKNKTAVKTRPQPWPAFKSQRRAPSPATAARPRRLWNIYGKCHLAACGQSIHGTLCKDGSSMFSWDPCVEFVAKKNQFFWLNHWNHGELCDRPCSTQVGWARARQRAAILGTLQVEGEAEKDRVLNGPSGNPTWLGNLRTKWALKEMGKSIENPSLGDFPANHVELLIPLSRKLVNFVVHDIRQYRRRCFWPSLLEVWTVHSPSWSINELGHLNPSEFCQVCQSVRLGHRHEQIS